ncbi:hypothetical protein [Reichenbachiella faecimaris]|nr:hypothetical protein [Reichenbachiella faecimaris]
MDTIRVKADRFLFIHDEAYYARVDTIFILPDTTDFYIRKNNMERTQEFYRRVETKMSKSKLANVMYDYMFSQNSSSPRTEEFHEQRFTPYERESISAIRYKHLPIFGATVKDTTIYKPSKFSKPINKAHVYTRDWVIRRNLTFQSGDRINPEDLVDSERLIRRLRYIKEARVMVNERPGDDQADIAVVTQDVFPYSLILSPNNDNDAMFGITSINIGGIGHEFEYDYIRNGGSDFFYRVANISGTFIDGELNYSHHFLRTGAGANLERDFVTQQTKYAGGASLNKYEFGEYNYQPMTDTTTTYSYNRNYANLWVGRAFQTKIKSQFFGVDALTNIVASAGVEHQDFYDQPVISADTNYRYHDRNTYLLSIGVSARNYYKDRFILQFGRTEDIPTGSALGIVTGIQTTEFRTRLYVGYNYARGGYVGKIGYLNGIISLGSFIKIKEDIYEETTYQNGILKLGIDYFTPLLTINQVKLRQFVDFTFSQAIIPDEEYILNSQSDIGIRGVRGYYHRATSKVNIKLETVMFTPINFLEFRMAAFGFLDYTVTKNSENDFFGTDHFLGLGGGIRLRNDNLAFSTIQVRFGYYPSTPINASYGMINLATAASVGIRDFNFKAPEIIPF